MKPFSKIGSAVTFASAALALAAPFAFSQEYPAQDIHALCNYGPGGKLRIVAVTSENRSGALPDVPTLAEAGYGGGNVAPWWGVVVSLGTPRPIVDKLAGWFNQITAAEDTRQFLARAAFDPLPGSPDTMQALMKSDAVRWRRYAELAKIRPQ